MYIREAKFVCLDTETTGLSFDKGGRVCEIALLTSKEGKRVNSYTTLINPEMYISPEVTAIHGITNEMVALAPHFKDIALTLADYLESSVLICHNVAFDVPFLEAYILCWLTKILSVTQFIDPSLKSVLSLSHGIFKMCPYVQISLIL